MKILQLVPRVPAITVPLTCNFCLRDFWPKPAFYARHLPRVVKALHPMERMEGAYACPKCAEDEVWKEAS